ncbi:hemagglutinin/amebocyte aggregation factor-like [Dendronephthya gigantea]|uniref:hemagglutinin/amebocyte aggregation factor-like n=1 Tax=Dendronephthya gigantea TaxID=151771 RepID=UPI00106CE94E|nr:hemagglutinin/amebocyte aggregation factor-like [Dendronephthya gigantea]
MKTVILAFCLLLVNAMNIMAWTRFDAPWSFQCGRRASISHISSFHSNHHEDRSWIFHCRRNAKITNRCGWTGFVNWFDRQILFQCPNGVITGVRSYHSNHHEDRRFRFRCCRTRRHNRDCTWTPFQNYWDGKMNFNVARYKFLVGVQSIHDNRREDRRWKFLVCRKN